MSTPKISVIICTRNRVRYLDGSVGSLQTQSVPTESFEIILVDNSSTDGTAQWAANVISQYNNLKIVSESKLGLSHARNAGCKAAQGEILAYLDDDAIASPKWLESVMKSFASSDDKLAVVGGRVTPYWEATKPEWLDSSLWPLLSVLDLGETQRPLTPQEYFVGANMTIRKSALLAAGGFRTDLGRKGNNLLSNEEIHLKANLEKLGFYTLYNPAAEVQHSIPIERLTKKWFRKRMYWQGISDSYMNEDYYRCRELPLLKRGRKSAGRIYRSLLLTWGGISNCWKWHRPDQFGNELYFWLCAGKLVGEWKVVSSKQ